VYRQEIFDSANLKHLGFGASGFDSHDITSQCSCNP